MPEGEEKKIHSWTIGWRSLVNYLIVVCLFYLAVVIAACEHVTPAGGLLMTCVPAAILAWVMLRRLVLPLNHIIKVSGELADGNLDRQIMVDSRDEMGELARSINMLAGRLRKMKRKISEETDLSRAILNSMNEGVVAVNQEGRVILVNPAVERTLAVSGQNCLNKDVVGVVRDYELERCVHEVLKNRVGLERELQIFIPDARTFSIHVTPLSGIRKGVVAILHDITETKRMERMRSDFFVNVSHELRTPLTSIEGFLETLLDGAVDDPVSARRFLEIVSTETKRLTRLIDGLFMLSDIENRRRPLKNEQVDIPEIIQRVQDMFSVRVKEKQIDFQARIEENFPLVEGDGDLITQVLINLVDNAVKYTPDGGKIEVEAYLEQSEAILQVTDSGAGIDEENLPRIFERFYRVDKARSREQGGSGLGLAIVKHVLDFLGGSVEVKSKVGRGSVFTVHLPKNGQNY